MTEMRIGEIRRQRGYPQAYVAEKVGVDQSAVARWEAGASYPGAERLPRLAEVLGTSIDELFVKAAGRLPAAE